MVKFYSAILVGFLLFVHVSCKKNTDEIKPANKAQDENAAITAMVNGAAFNGTNAVKSYKLAFTLTASAGGASITIGTNFPPSEGTFNLSTRDPFAGQNFYGSYTSNENVEYRTKDNSGSLTITKVRVDGSEVKELRGKFSFKGYTASGAELEVKDGVINFSE